VSQISLTKSPNSVCLLLISPHSHLLINLFNRKFLFRDLQASIWDARVIVDNKVAVFSGHGVRCKLWSHAFKVWSFTLLCYTCTHRRRPVVWNWNEKFNFLRNKGKRCFMYENNKFRSYWKHQQGNEYWRCTMKLRKSENVERQWIGWID